MGYVKTGILMIGLVLIFMFVGNAIGGAEGMKIAFFAACGMNFFSYFLSDALVLKHYQAKEVNNANAPELYQIVQRLANNAKLPMPKVYIVPEDAPNAFATGRNPQHAAVTATKGLLKMMSPQEIEGVLAHEMSHVRNYDILTGTIAATFAGAIAYLANFARARTANQQRGNGAIAAIMMPIAASIIQMSISREREYKADEGSANLTGHPMWLASALQKLEDAAKGKVLTGATAQNSHMFIVNPLGLSKLFSTHPSTQDRIKRLQEIALGMRAE